MKSTKGHKVPHPTLGRSKAMEPTALEELHDSTLDLIRAEEKLERARRAVRYEFEEELIKLYNKYGLRVACSVDFEVTIESHPGNTTVEEQFGPRKK